MAKFLVVKIKYEDKIHKVEATRASEDQSRLTGYNGDEKVAEFPSEKVEYWSLDTE